MCSFKPSFAHENCLNICRYWFRVTKFANFDFFLCLLVKFHNSLVWVPILTAGGPYWVPISQKVGSLPIGSLFQSLEIPISFGDSEIHCFAFFPWVKGTF